MQNCLKGQPRVQAFRSGCSYEEIVCNPAIQLIPTQEAGAEERLRGLGSRVQGQENIHGHASMLRNRAGSSHHHRHIQPTKTYLGTTKVTDPDIQEDLQRSMNQICP